MTNFQYEVMPDVFQGVTADRMEVVGAGVLLFSNIEVSADQLIERIVPTLAVAPGRWLTAFPED